MITTNYGPGYTNAHKGTRSVKKVYGIKQLKRGWMVYCATTGDAFEIFPTKLRAYYAATRLNGTDVSTVFYFGDTIFG